MPTAYPSFATPEQYATLTGISPAPDGTQELLDAASASIRRYCGWHIAPVVTEDILVDGNGGTVQSFPTLRLLDVSDLTEVWSGSVTYALTPDQYEWSANGYLRKTSCGIWTQAFRGITATIKHGFELVDCGDLTQLCITMAARAAASPFGMVQQNVGQVSIRMSSGSANSAGGISLYSDQAEQLNGYKLFGRA